MDKIPHEFARLLRKKLKNRVKSVVLFGSRARGDFIRGADYDILVVVDKRQKSDENTLLNIGVDFLNKYNVLIGDFLCDEAEWERKRRFPIGLNIQKEGIHL
jgi:hypothetical protein